MDILFMRTNGTRWLPVDDERPAGRILVADRDSNVRATIESLLTMAGCEVRAEASMAAGLRCMRDWNPTLVMLDPDLRRGAPLDVIRAFWDAGQRRIPIILLGGEDLLRQDGFEPMISGSLPKPFDVRDLLTTAARFVTCRES